ncbi:hypothetical protein V6N12_013222 [Hibiscus sabdariffa]|uniref:Uncharacterized protein n=1 Tax=Hibiscus sabdariffa TaxID=183260 RepID=A0ABR2D5W1_9ROSI
MKVKPSVEIMLKQDRSKSSADGDPLVEARASYEGGDMEYYKDFTTDVDVPELQGRCERFHLPCLGMYVCCPEVWVWSLIALTQLVLHPSAADIHTTGGVVIAATVHNSREYLALLSFKFGYVFMVVG